MARPFRLAVAQTPAELASPTARLDWLGRSLAAIAAQKADLLLLPELFATGYNIGDAVLTYAEPADGHYFQTIAALAQRYGIAIHYGFAERAGATLYNAAQCVAPDGAPLCLQRKLAIPPGNERKYFAPGAGCQMFDYRGIKIATLICYDAEFSETVRHVAALGAQLVLVPTALGKKWGWVAHQMIPTRAFENGVFLAYANSAGVENGMEFLGASTILAPDGETLARAGATPDVLYADLDLHRIEAAQTRLPYLTERAALKL